MELKEKYNVKFEYKDDLGYDFSSISSKPKIVNRLTALQEENIRNKIQTVLENSFEVIVVVPFDKLIIHRYNSDWSYVFSYSLEDNDFDITDDMIGCIKTIIKKNAK